MIDLNQILASMTAAIQSSEFPNSSEIAGAPGLDLSTATITTTRSGVLAIVGARLPALSNAEVGVVGASTPRKGLDWVFFNSTIPVGPYLEAAAGDGRRVERSKHGQGLTIAFEIDEFDCGMTASAPDGVVQTLFCAARSEARLEQAGRLASRGLT